MLLRDSCAWMTSIFGLDHVLDPECQVRHGDLFLDAIVHAVDALVMVAGKVQHRLAHRLAGNCPGVDADAAHHFAPLDHRDALAHLRALDRRALPGRTRTDDDQIITLHCDQSNACRGSDVLQFENESAPFVARTIGSVYN